MTIVMHSENPERYGIVIYPAYNRTREDAQKELPAVGDEELSILGPASNHKNPLTVKGFRWGYAPHPQFRGQRILTYRGKPCFQYPLEAPQ